MKAWSSEKISVMALVLLITGAIDSIRNLPTTALFGSTLIFFFIFAAIMFLIPVALISAELSSTWSEEEGGIYNWVENAFGSQMAFITIWLQWVNTMVWYPTILLFIASALAYLIDPALSNNKLYLCGVTLSVYWGLTLVGLSGIRASARFAGICAILGMIIPMGLMIALAVVWIIHGNPIAIDLSFHNLVPTLGDQHSWISLTAIMTSFLGMELASTHVRNVHNPQKNFPKAMFFSVLLILLTMILGSLSIAFVLPQSEISLVSGVMQAFQNFLNAYHLSVLMPVIIIMILIGSVGSMINWIISPAKGLMLSADEGYLPKWLYHFNAHGTPHRVLLLQAVLVTLLCSGFILLPSINSIYWFFTDLSTELYMLMYVLMFLAAVRLKYRYHARHRPFKIPGGKMGYYGTCAIGLIGTLMTLFIGFFPPEQAMDVGGAGRFRLVFSLGIVAALSPALLICLLRKQTVT